jgi:hypothetical protein
LLLLAELCMLFGCTVHRSWFCFFGRVLHATDSLKQKVSLCQRQHVSGFTG